MRQAARTLGNILKLLPELTYFNVVSFGSKFTKLFPTSQPLTDAQRVRALLHVAGLTANMGGTDVLEPLKAVSKMPPRENSTRQVVLLTDGEVKNTQDVVKEARQGSHNTRIFSFGIGRDADKELVTGLARAGGGKAAFCINSADIRTQVRAQVERALSPALTNLNVWWYGLDAVQAPYKVRPIFHQEPYTMYGLVTKDNRFPDSRSARVFGKLPNGNNPISSVH